MKLTLLAVGTRMPAWVTSGFEEYRKRLPPEIRLNLRELPLGQKGKSADARSRKREAESIRSALPPRDRLVALDVEGRPYSTEQLANLLAGWQMSGDNYSIVIGGPDGIDDALLDAAELRWSLSPLTLPHPLVRVVLAEQLYRAWTINAGHPYHRS